ncbi:MAG: antitoxin VapB family protein [Candidatus Aenigmatarchaeota archaeon]
MVKTITVTNEAYEMLRKMKSGDESFSEVIKRVAKPRVNLRDYFGILPKEGAEEARKSLKERRKRISKSIEARKNVYSR